MAVAIGPNAAVTANAENIQQMQRKGALLLDGAVILIEIKTMFLQRVVRSPRKPSRGALLTAPQSQVTGAIVTAAVLLELMT